MQLVEFVFILNKEMQCENGRNHSTCGMLNLMLKVILALDDDLRLFMLVLFSTEWVGPMTARHV